MKNKPITLAEDRACAKSLRHVAKTWKSSTPTPSYMKKKPVKIPDCGWGSETKKLKGPFKNLKDVTETRMYHGTKKPDKKGFFGEKYEWEELPKDLHKWDKIHRIWTPMFLNGVENVGKVELVTIQKKHLDEAAFAIYRGLAVVENLMMEGKSKIRVQIQMREALKNISVK